jgi:tyrosine-protein kinase Etk/Wzc
VSVETSPIRENIAKQLNSSFDFRKLLAAIVAGWYWFALALLITGGSAFLYLRYTTPVYAIRSTLLLEDKSNNVSGRVLSAISSSGGAAPADVGLYNAIFLLRSQDLVRQAVDSLQLNVRYYVEGRIKETEIYQESPIHMVFDTSGYTGGGTKLIVKQTAEGVFEVANEQSKKTDKVPFGSWVNNGFGRYRIVYSESPAANKEYLKNVEIKVRIEHPNATVGRILSDFQVLPADGRTSMLELSTRDNLQQRGIDFQTMLLKLYRKSELEQAVASTQKTRDFINENLVSLERTLQNTDDRVSAIKVAQGVVDVNSQASQFYAAKSDAEHQVEKLQMQKRVLGMLHQSVAEGSSAIAGLAVDDVSLNGLVNSYNSKLAEVEAYNDNEKTPKSYPERQKAQLELATLRKRILDAAEKVSSALDLNIQAAYSQANIAGSRLSAVPMVDRSIKDVQRNYETQNNLYLLLYQQRLQNEIAANALQNNSKIIVAPYGSGVPTSPIPRNIYVIAVLIGLLIPGSIFVTRELFNNKLGNEQDIINITGIPIIGSISKGPDGDDVVVGETIRTGIAEQFRLVRANLDFMTSSNPANKKVIMVTSSVSQEGKSFISINLGLTIAIASKRVIILEFDLRKPKISERLDLSRDGGISGYLAGLVGLDKVIKESKLHPNLFVANCGPIPPNPAELLLLPRTKKMMEELQNLFDVILIDTAPIGMVSDAFILSQFSGVNLLITRQGRTIKEHIRMLDATYRDGKLPNPAIVFNGVEHQKRYGYGYGYGSGYGYGYGYGYGENGGYYEEATGSRKKKRGLKLFRK